MKIISPILISLFISGLTACSRKDAAFRMESPGQILRIEIGHLNNEMPAKLYYSVYMLRGDSFYQVMELSPLGLEREDTRFVENLELISVKERREVKETYTLRTGKRLENTGIFNELTLTYRNQDRAKVALQFRAFDRGIAFRYQFPEENDKHFRVIREVTGFHFSDGNFWGHPYDAVTTWTPAYETYFTGPLEVGTPAPAEKKGWAFPFLVESEGAWMLVSEAGFDGTYGASHLEQECYGGEYAIRFAEQNEAEGYYENTSHSTLPWSLPWRFVAIGPSPAEVVETSLPTDLAAPSMLADPGWIKPGRASWSWWSDSESPQDYKRLIPFVDFAEEMGWEYSLVDANWNLMKNGNIEQLAAYAENKGIGLLLWYNSGGKHNVVAEQPRDLMDDREKRRKEFERIAGMGIRGIKVDFFQSDKQEIIKQYLGILEDAAAYQLLVNVHGCTLPRGWRRTWPNLVTMESVRGGESYKFDADFPALAPAHLTIVPFTRNAVGPVDYTPGGFSEHNYPHLTTYGFEMALPILLESGIMHYMDTPEVTAGLPPSAVELLRELPVTWDDTRFVAGYPGREVVIARKKGEKWYIAGINGENTEKELTIDLSVTGNPPGEITLIMDGSNPNQLTEKTLETDRGRISLKLLPYGGFTGSW